LSARKLPPIPKPPLPPPRRPSDTFTTESTTEPRNETWAQFQALASVFDEMNAEQRTSFVELAYAFKTMSVREQEDLLAQALVTVFPEGT
jgi:hypothetical protein